MLFRSHFLLHGLDGSRLQHHLDLVFGSCQQFDGPVLAEAGPVHLEEHGPVVGLDPQRDGDVDDRGNTVHYPGFRGSLTGSVLGVGGADGGRCSDAEEDHSQAGH